MLANKAMTVLDINKKRKLTAEQLSLPTSKHQCWNGILPSRSPIFSRNLNGDDDFSTCSAEDKSERFTTGQGPKTGSAKDSNSYDGDPESTISEKTSKYEVAGIKVLQSGSSSGSFSNYSTCFQDSDDCSDAMMVAATDIEPVNDDADVEAVKESYDEALLEFDSQSPDDYLHSACGYYSLEQYHGKEIEENPCSNVATPNLYALSSGRRSVTKEGQRTSRKPTIDQEFEEYFSNLML